MLKWNWTQHILLKVRLGDLLHTAVTYKIHFIEKASTKENIYL